LKLGLHNLGLLVIVTHSSAPSAETFESVGGVLSDLGDEQVLAIGGLEVEVRLKELNSFLIHVILLVVGEVLQVSQEGTQELFLGVLLIRILNERAILLGQVVASRGNRHKWVHEQNVDSVHNHTSGISRSLGRLELIDIVGLNRIDGLLGSLQIRHSG
jgi:hypothetical protein